QQIIGMGPDVLNVRVKYDTVQNGQVVSEPKRLGPTDLDCSGVYGRGIMRFYRTPAIEAPPVSAGMCFFSGVEASSEEARKKCSAVSMRHPEKNDHPWVVNLRGTWMRLDAPTTGVPAKGLVVHLTSY